MLTTEHSRSNPASRNSLHRLGSEWTVIIWDPYQDRLRSLTQAVSECGAQPLWIKELSAIEQIEYSNNCSIALVALGSCQPLDALGLDVIRRLRKKGFKVIGYEERICSW